MENAVEALKMAAAVLTFVLALGIGMSSFSQAKQTAEIVLSYVDREFSTQYVQDLGTTERIVGKETIIPTIYRAYKEYYKIYFYDTDGSPIELYTRTQNGVQTSVNYIDLTEEILGNERQADNFIMALLYGSNAELKDADGNDIDFGTFEDSLGSGNTRIDLNTRGICDTILVDGNQFLERFGVYYPSDAREGAGEDVDEEENADAQDANELKMRVISYYLQ